MEKVLIADDDPAILRFVSLIVREAGYEVVTARDGNEALELARFHDPNLMVLDVMMPGIDGLHVCEQIRREASSAHASIILLTAKVSATDLVAGLSAGADDYVSKPFHPDELIARIKAAIKRSQEMRAINPLTGLPGNMQIHAEIKRRVAAYDPVAILYVDLDSFKSFNDRYGFMRGDEAIELIARVCCRVSAEFPGSFVGHIGGDDFLLIADPKDAEPMCQEIVRRFDEAVPCLYDSQDRDHGYVETLNRLGHTVKTPLLTVSIGCAVSEGHRPIDYRTLISLATEMKSVAKRSPHSGYVFDRRCE